MSEAVPLVAPAAALVQSLRQLVAQKHKPLPEWLIIAELPAVYLDETRLVDTEITGLVLALRAGKPGALHPLMDTIRQTIDRRSLDALAWALFQQWDERSGEPADKWALYSLAAVGSDGCALRLVPLIREWPSLGRHKRAGWGLECLRAMGTDVALMQLATLARRLPSASLKKKAQAAVSEIAHERGLSVHELEDRVIPDCGLDERGTRTFSLGTKTLSFAFGPALKPMLQDEQGKLRPGVPRAAAADDPRLVEDAKRDWEVLKKQVSEVVKVQSGRLKQAMTGGRRWSIPAFQAMASHPMMSRIVRTLLWGVHDPSADPGRDASGWARLVRVFRVTEEGDLADHEDVPLAMPAEGERLRISVVHPVYLTPEARMVWGQMLSDYELIPPFPQLSRTAYLATAEELSAGEITRYQKASINAMLMSPILGNMGWHRNMPNYQGAFYNFSRAFDFAGLTAVMEDKDTNAAAWESRSVARIYFVRGALIPAEHEDYTRTVPLSRVDPALISEVIHDVEGVIAAAAKAGA